SVSGGTSRCLGTRTSGQQRPGRTWGVEASFSGETRGQWTRNYVRAAVFGLRGKKGLKSVCSSSTSPLSYSNLCF
ncbi:unnamed protein product, partial [Heterosigma akashiwo]